MRCSAVFVVLSCIAVISKAGYQQNSGYGRDYDVGPMLPSVPGLGMGLGPNELRNLLSSFGMIQIDRIPAVAQHVYGSPQKLVISDYHGPMKQLHGTVRSFHQVRTIDNGGQTFGGHSGSNSYGSSSSSSGFEDFMFPPDW